ncbi:hypothetical protein [Streptomyces sp. MZ04]|uniref:hypothetical protein n=1 Tax=Streptomyces sp. MZ04 TaxID=2559236 RepID=UPI001FD861A9|nr:hypothetical protein [Streptomyces sp. MZ04]
MTTSRRALWREARRGLCGENDREPRGHTLPRRRRTSSSEVLDVLVDVLGVLGVLGVLDV